MLREDYRHLATILLGIRNIGQHRWVTRDAVPLGKIPAFCDIELHELYDAQKIFCYYRAAAYELIMIGEAANYISESGRATASAVPWRGIIDTRNRLAHEPWSMDIEFLERIITNHLPVLEEQITSLLRHSPS